MMSRDSDIDVLDSRFPFPLTMPASCFWEMTLQRPDRAALPGLVARARADEAIYQERFVAPVTEPIPLPALAALPDETQRFGDEFPRDVLADTEYLYQPPATMRDLDRDLHRTERRHVLHRVRRAITRGRNDEWLA